MAAFISRLNQRQGWAAGLELFSPHYALSMASPAAAMLTNNRLWIALAAQTVSALSLFGLITFLLPRAWKEGKSGGKARYLYSTWRAFEYGSGEARRRLRGRLLQINPILWLSSRERFGPMGFAMILLVLAFAISCSRRDCKINSS